MRPNPQAVFLLFAGLVAAPPARADELPTPGSLTVTGTEGAPVDMPLRHTRVSIEVTAFVSRATIEQVFTNPFDTPVEAVYTFPLGDRAAVDDFELTVGDRTIRGEIRRHDEARQAYRAARAAGFRAALLEQERPNIFTQSVANLEPGKDVTVRLRTVETLPYERGTYRLAFPLVVGPRYIPGNSVGASEATKIVPPRLAAGMRSGHDVAINVTIDAGVPLREMQSVSHRIVSQRVGPTSMRLRLAQDDAIPNKDFQLRWSVAADRPAVGVLAHRDGLDGFFTLLVQPKGDVDVTEEAPKEMTLVVDTSGSMRGTPLQASRRFIAKALLELGPRDTFNVIRFSGDNEIFSTDPLPNTRADVARAIAWVNAQRSGGGTEMLSAMRAAFARPRDPNRIRVVVFLTDGEVGDDDEILSEIGKVLGDARIYTVGIGSSVNRYLLDRMADLGRGAFVSIRPDESADDALDAFRSWVTRPYLTDLSVDWGSLPVVDVSPDPIYDLGSGQTLTLVGRYLHGAADDVVVRGKLGGRYWQRRLHVVLPDAEAKHAPLASLWARWRIENLLLASPGSPTDSVRAEVTSLALDYRLMTTFTSFVAVDESALVNPAGDSPTIRQAVPMPDGATLAGVFGAEGPSALSADPDDPRDTEDADADDDVDSGEVGQAAGPSVPPPAPQPSESVQHVIVMAEKAAVETRSVNPDGDGSPNVNGAREREFTTQVSGVSGVDPLSAHFLNEATGDSIESITVVSAGAGAEFGRAQGGFAEIVASGTKFSSEFIADLPVAGRLYPSGVELTLGVEDSSDDDNSEGQAEASRARLRDRAFRVLADLADDGKLSPAEGRPALTALLAAQIGSGAIAADVATHAMATWALAEAARLMPKDPWIGAARDKAVDYLASLVTPEGWPKRPDGRIDVDATRWARLVLRMIRPDAVAAIAEPPGKASQEYARLTGALAAAKSGATPVRSTARAPFDRLVATIGRGHLRL